MRQLAAGIALADATNRKNNKNNPPAGPIRQAPCGGLKITKYQYVTIRQFATPKGGDIPLADGIPHRPIGTSQDGKK